MTYALTVRHIFLTVYIFPIYLCHQRTIIKMKKTTHYHGHRWTANEIKVLMTLWTADESLAIIAKTLNSSEYAILSQVHRLRKMGIPLKKRKAGNKEGRSSLPWTRGEVEYLIRRRNEKATNEEIGSELGRSWGAVQNMIAILRREGVDVPMRGMGVRRLWNPEDMKALHGVIPKSLQV